MDPLTLIGFGGLGEAAKLKVAASHYSLIFLFMLALHICESNAVPQLLGIFIHKIAETGTTGAMLFRD